MAPEIHVMFRGLQRDGSVEAAVQRWVTRLEGTTLDIQRASTVLARVRRHTLVVTVTLVFVDDSTRTVTTQHLDPYVAVADAFRAVRHQCLAAARVA